MHVCMYACAFQSQTNRLWRWRIKAATGRVCGLFVSGLFERQQQQCDTRTQLGIYWRQSDKRAHTRTHSYLFAKPGLCVCCSDFEREYVDMELMKNNNEVLAHNLLTLNIMNT